MDEKRPWVATLEWWLSEVPAYIGTALAVLFLACGALAVVALVVIAAIGLIF